MSISEIQIWSKSAPGKSIQERFDMALDMSDYAVKDTNEKIGIIGDPDSDVSPWEVIYNDERPSMLGWSLAWFAAAVKAPGSFLLKKNIWEKITTSWTFIIPRIMP